MLDISKITQSIYNEDFRTLRTNIKYSTTNRDGKVLLITSPEPGDGKSTISKNLAISLCQDNKNVLIIDGDLRKPSIHKLFRISNYSGLSEILIGEKTLSNSINKINPKLSVLTSGLTPPNSAELLDSDEMNSIINSVKNYYDYIIIDTTPLELVADAQILASKVDGVILVAKVEKTRKDSLMNCKKLINKIGGNIIGIVMNNVKLTPSKDSYY